jgi:hypothetical protein
MYRSASRKIADPFRITNCNYLDDTRSKILQSKVLGTVGEILSVGDPSLILVAVEMAFKLADIGNVFGSNSHIGQFH